MFAFVLLRGFCLCLVSNPTAVAPCWPCWYDAHLYSLLLLMPATPAPPSFPTTGSVLVVSLALDSALPVASRPVRLWGLPFVSSYVSLILSHSHRSPASTVVAGLAGASQGLGLRGCACSSWATLVVALDSGAAAVLAVSETAETGSVFAVWLWLWGFRLWWRFLRHRLSWLYFHAQPVHL